MLDARESFSFFFFFGGAQLLVMHSQKGKIESGVPYEKLELVRLWLARIEVVY